MLVQSCAYRAVHRVELADLVARAHGGELTRPDVDRGFAVGIRLVSGTS